MDPNRLLVLRAVARTGGVKPAARALHLTPSGVSQHLSKLEAEAGVPLVDRSRRGGGRSLVLTAAGRGLADRAEQLAAALASAEREVDLHKEQRGGTVRIGGFASVLNQVVASTVVSLSFTDPDIDPRIFEVGEEEGLAHLGKAGLDLLLSERPGPDDPPRPRTLVETDLVRDPFRIVVPASWPTDIAAEDILRGPWVLSSGRSASREALERVATDHTVSLDVRHGAVQAGTMLALVAAGLGAGIIPQLTLSYLEHGQVRVHPGPLDPGSRTITVLHHRDRASAATERVLDELRRQAAAEEQVIHAGTPTE
jgi:molybdate transport repressor ModE-like protein